MLHATLEQLHQASYHIVCEPIISHVVCRYGTTGDDNSHLRYIHYQLVYLLKRVWDLSDALQTPNIDFIAKPRCPIQS